MKLAVALAVASLALVLAQQPFAPNTPYSAYFDGQDWSVVAGCSGAACATLDDGLMTTGWYTMNLVTNNNGQWTDQQQAYGAGYLEGALTEPHIWNSFMTWTNGTQYDWNPALKTFVESQEKFVRRSISHPTENLVYWNQVGLEYARWDGLVAGYNAFALTERGLAYDQLLAYQLQDELGDFASGLNLTNVPTIDQPWLEHCSSLVKVSADGQRLFAAQDTWSQFESMLRIWKNLDLNYGAAGTAAPGLSFSSYPGNIPSVDDYYVTSANLVVMETTNGVMNSTLYMDNIKTTTVPYWCRVMVANRMAASGQDWMTIFALYNSGSYNNQWILVDNKLFVPGQPLQANTLWIGEQVPGYFVAADQTDTLIEKGYWASYNIPFYPFIYNVSGYWPFFDKYGNTYSHDDCARAKIFRRDEGQVQTLQDMKRIMRYNEYQTDPLSEQDSCRGISARCDLNPPWANNPLNSYSAFGAIDSKITSNSMSASRATAAVAGPTWDSQNPFAWTQQFKYNPHFGQPTVFAFDWVTMVPNPP